MSSLTIATNSQKLDLQIHFERLIYNINSEPRRVLIPFKQYGCPKKSTQIIFLQHFQKQFQYFQYFLVSRSNFRCNSFPKSAFSSDLGLSKSNIFCPLSSHHDEGGGGGSTIQAYSNTSKRYPQIYSGFGTEYPDQEKPVTICYLKVVPNYFIMSSDGSPSIGDKRF